MTTADSSREERFRSLFTETYEDVLRFAQRRGAPAFAEDVAAEAFVVAWRRLDDAPRRPSDARAWLFGIARHYLLNTRRGENRRTALAVRIAEAEASVGHGHDADADLIARRIDLAAAWGRLDDGEQEVLALTVFDDLRSAEAGRVLGISAAAYRIRVLRARRALRRHLELDDASSVNSLTVQEDAL